MVSYAKAKECSLGANGAYDLLVTLARGRKVLVCEVEIHALAILRAAGMVTTVPSGRHGVGTKRRASMNRPPDRMVVLRKWPAEMVKIMMDDVIT